jgi:3-oxoacyl-ACP reductase-like protein
VKPFGSSTANAESAPAPAPTPAPAPAPAPTPTPQGNYDPSLPVSEEVAKNCMTMMMALFQQNTELHNKIIEMCKNAGMTNSNNTICGNNSNNNTFNMNMFLNEKCKDAMNMKDFVDSIQVNMTKECQTS